MIKPCFQTMYNYGFEDSGENINLTIPFPDVFDENQLKIEITEDSLSIKIYADDLVPFVAGKLVAGIKSYSKSVEGSNFKITLIKEKNEPWPIFITTNDPETHLIDPKSAFLIYKLFEQQKEESEVTIGYLEYSAQLGFVPAMRQYATLKFREKNMNIGLQLLTICVDKYDDAASRYQLSLIYSQLPGMMQKAFELMKKAANQGLPDAMIGLGEFLSPLSNVNYAPKDVEESVKWLKKGLEYGENWIGLHELAKCYLYGIGCPKNFNKAISMQRRAKELNPNVPPMELTEDVDMNANGEEEDKSDPVPLKQRLIIGGATVAAVAGFGALIFNFIRKHK